jgi:hypothetical protein
MAECRDAALTLAHAFAADDYAQYLVADDGEYDVGSSGSDDDGNVGGGGRRRNSRGLTSEEDKWRLHVDILTYTVASHCMSGLVRAVGAECDAVALWYVFPFFFTFLGHPQGISKFVVIPNHQD